MNLFILFSLHSVNLARP